MKEKLTFDILKKKILLEETMKSKESDINEATKHFDSTTFIIIFNQKLFQKK